MPNLKPLLLSLTLLLLTACIPTDDFGKYWERGIVDTAVVGKWEKVSAPKEKRRQESVRIAESRGRYVIDSLDERERRQKDYAPVHARSLSAGKYTFFMAMTRENGRKSFAPEGLVRYKLQGDVLKQYDLSDRHMAAFLKKKYPKAKNITAPECREKCLFDSVKIRKLDDEVVRILADIPDTKDFWTVSERWKRVK